MKKLILLFIFLLSGCTRIKLQDYLYPISIGLDYKDNNFYIYYHVVSYSKISKKENESSFDENYESIILKGYGPTIYEALKKVNNITKTSISTTHIRSFIVSTSLINNNENYLSLIKYFYDTNYLRSNINIFSTDSILDVYTASKIIDNTSYSNEINHPTHYLYLEPMNYLNFLKNVYDNRTTYLPFIIIDKNSSSYVEEGETKDNKIIEINGAIFINNKYFKYLSNDKIKGNYYMFNREYIGIEIINKVYMIAKKLTYKTKLKDKIIFSIKLTNCNFYLNNLDIEEAKLLIEDKIKKDINETYINCYDSIDIYHLNDYKNRFNINNKYDVEVIFKQTSFN